MSVMGVCWSQHTAHSLLRPRVIQGLHLLRAHYVTVSQSGECGRYFKTKCQICLTLRTFLVKMSHEKYNKCTIRLRLYDYIMSLMLEYYII